MTSKNFVIVKYQLDDLKTIANFQVLMAKETENKDLDFE